MIVKFTFSLTTLKYTWDRSYFKQKNNYLALTKCFSMTYKKRHRVCSVMVQIKACAIFFYQIFIFSPNDSLLRNYEKCFLFILKSSCRSGDNQIFVIFSLPSHTFLIQKDQWKWNNLWCHELACINFQM